MFYYDFVFNKVYSSIDQKEVNVSEVQNNPIFVISKNGLRELSNQEANIVINNISYK